MRSILALALLPALSAGQGSAACHNDVVKRIDAPGGERSAVLFQRSCGATTDLSTQVSVVSVGEDAVEAGNAFRADTDHGLAVPAPWGGPWAEAVWLSPRRLRIRHDESARIFAAEPEVANVTIEYEPVAR